MPPECTQTADVLLFFDELFDSMNGSSTNSKKRSGKDLLLPVTPISNHGTVWSNAKNVFKSMKFISHNNNQPNQKLVTVPTVNNWLQTIKNMEYLIQKLFNDFHVKSVWMRHLNQDPLENFFGAIRSHGCRNNNPTVAGFESSFAALLINNLSSGQHSLGSNCEEDNCHTIFNSMETLFEKVENEPIYTDLIDTIDDTIYVPFEEKKNCPRILATLQFVTGYLLKKAKIKIFKNCKKCKQCLHDPNNTCDFLKLREYKKGKTYLTYPSSKLVIIFSKIQDVITHIIKKNPMSPNIKVLLKTYLYTELDFDFLDCEMHKSQVIEIILELSCNFFIYNWCRDVNKIINGTRLDLDDSDTIKIAAFNLFNKRKHRKLLNQ